jgi:hypothetical protein
MMLIGLTGKAGAGKDTVGDFLCWKFGFATYAFAHPLKAGCMVMFGLSKEQCFGAEKEIVDEDIGMSPRRILQLAGTEFGRNMIANDIWIRRATKELKQLQSMDSDDFRGLVVTDVRFENEAAWIRDNGGVLWHIERPSVKSVVEHSSEAGVELTDKDYVIVNSGSLDDLQSVVMATYLQYTQRSTTNAI